ncbi:hypothetical protein [Desulfovibrio litoralis]|uniref:Phage MuF C-terminal domain-containing protein n=1 Tax=Desulfovibrio litoralis DSM 11393 TaxID=1121455 RepID=A0A1M7T829_9BACT|nr:hypothetical protein [Desulfovibrio litoralis]SHN66890.1 hypothetical protein SAMN02745728_01706 [Desulfovibrio litoralis DSM 11393]
MSLIIEKQQDQNQPNENNNYLYSPRDEETGEDNSFTPPTPPQPVQQTAEPQQVQPLQPKQHKWITKADVERSVMPAIIASEGLTLNNIVQSKTLSKELNLTPEVISQNIAKAEQMALVKRLEQMPAVNNWVAESTENAIIYKEDTAIGKTASFYDENSIKRSIEDIENSAPFKKEFDRWTGSTRESFYHSSGFALSHLGNVFKAIGFDNDNVATKNAYLLRDTLYKYATEERDHLKTSVKSLKVSDFETWDSFTNSSLFNSDFYSEGISDLIGGMTPGLLVTAMGGGNFGYGVMGMSDGGSLEKELLSQGVAPETALSASTAQMGISAILDKVGLEGVFKKNLNKATNSLAKKTINKATATVVAGGREGVTEYLQDLARPLATSWALGENIEQATTRFLNAAKQLDSLVLAFLFGGAGNIGYQATSALQQKQIETQVNDTQEKLKTLDELASESKTRELMPEKFEEFAERASEHSDMKDVYINAETFFQSDIINNEPLLDKLGIDQNMAYTALALGDSIKVPLAKYQTYIAGTPVSDQLKEGVKFSEQDYTVKESKEFSEHEAEKALNVNEEYTALNNELELEKQRHREMLTGAIQQSPNLFTELSSREGGVEEYINTWLHMFENGATRIGGGSLESTLERFKRIKEIKTEAFGGNTKTETNGDINTDDSILTLKDTKNWTEEQFATLTPKQLASLEEEYNQTVAKEVFGKDLLKDKDPRIKHVWGTIDGKSLKRNHPYAYKEIVRNYGVGIFGNAKKGAVGIDVAAQSLVNEKLAPLDFDEEALVSLLSAPRQKIGNVLYQEDTDLTPAFLPELVKKSAELETKEQQAIDYGRRVKEASKKWAEGLNKLQSEKPKANEVLQAGRTSEVLKALGVKDLPTIMLANKMKSVLEDKGLPLSFIKTIPEQLASPVMVFDSKTQADSLVVLTDYIHEGMPVVVAIHLNTVHGNIEVNKIASIHGRSGKAGFIKEQIQSGNLRYWNKNKSFTLNRALSGLQLPTVMFNAKRFDDNKILTDKDIVKPIYEEEFYQDKKTAKPPRGSLKVADDGYTVTLSENANVSTLFHETAHYFLLEIKHMVDNGLVDESLQADYQTILDYLEVKNNNINRDQHEEFAKAVESYLMEGNAPNSKLAKAFARFKRWLTNLYKNSLQLKVPLNDGIRGVFDRLIANEVEVRQTAYNNELNDLTNKQLDALGVVGPDRSFVKSLMEQAIEKATEKRFIRNTKNRRERLKGFAQEAKTELEKQQVYKLRKDLGNKDANGEVKALDKETIAALFGVETANKLQKKLKVGSLKNQGGNPAKIAKEYGYKNVDEMVADLLNSAPISYHINEIVKKRNAQFEKNNIDPEALLLEQEEIETQFAFINRHVAKLNGSEHIEQAKIDDAAVIKMQGMPLSRAVSHKSFLNAMRFARRRELLAISKGEWKTAYESGLQVRFNLAFAKLALENQKNIDTFTKSVKSFVNNKKADPNARYMVMALGLRYGITKADTRLADGRSHKTFVDWIEQSKDQGYDLIVDDNIMYNDGKPLNKLTVGEYEALKEQLNQIMTIEENLRTIKTEQGKIELEALTTEIADSITAKNKIKTHNLVADDNAIKQTIAGVHYGLAKVETTMMQVDGNNQGLLWLHGYKPVSDALDNKNIRMTKEQAKVEAIFRKHFTQKELNSLSDKTIAIEGLNETIDNYGLKNKVKNKIKGFISFNNKEVLHSKENLLCVALNLGNGINRQRLLASGLTQDNILAITDKLTQKDWEFCQDIWDFLESFREESFALEERLRGLRPQKVEASPVITKYGTFRGGYYPIAYDVKKSENARQFNEKELMKDEFGGTHTQTKQGHLKQRAKQGLGTPLIYNFGVLTSHAYNVVHDITMREAILDTAKIFRDKKVSTALTQSLGTKGHGIFMPWLKDIAREKKEPSTYIESSMRWFRSRTTTFVLGYKLGTVILQSTGFAIAANRIGAKNLALGFKKVFGNGLNPIEQTKQINALWAETKDLSQFMAGRLKSFDRDIKDAGNFLEIESGVVKFTQKHALTAIGYAQLGVDMVVFHGALEQGIKLYNGNMKKAVAHADQVVRLTQGSGRVSDLSAIQRGSELTKIMTMFYSFFNTMYNLTALNFTEIQRAETKGSQISLTANFILWTQLIPLAMSIAFQALKGKEMPDDEEAWLKMIGLEFLQQTVGMFPFARDFASVAQGYNYQLSPVVGSVNMLVRSSYDILTVFGEDKKKKGKKKVRNEKLKKGVTGAIRTGGFVNGIASEGVARFVENIWNYMDGTSPELELRKTILR